MVSLHEGEEEQAPGGLGEYEYNITRFIQSFFPEEQNYIVNLPVDRAYVRDLKIPIVNAKHIAEVIPSEVENQVPISLDEAEVIGHAWEIGEESSNVITFTARHDNLEAAVQPFKKVNASIRMLSLDAVGLAGAIRLMQPEDYEDRVIAQLDIGGEQTILNVLRNGELVFTRKIPYGGQAVTEVVADVLRIEPAAAEARKLQIAPDLSEGEFAVTRPENFFRRHRIEEQDYDVIVERSREVFEDIASEIERSILSVRGTSPEVYYISGGGSLQPGAANLLEKLLEKPVREYPLRMTVPGEDVGNWVTALGTGEHYRLKSAQRIDFLESPFGSTLRGGEFNFNFFATPVLLGITSIIILLVSFLVSIWTDRQQIRKYNRQIYQVARQIDGMNLNVRKSRLPSARRIMAKARDLCRRRLASLNSSGDGAGILSVLKDISERTPTRQEMFFRLKRFRYDGSAVQFDADLDGYERIAPLQQKLAGSRYFSKVQVGQQRRILNDKVRVSMKLILKRNEKAAAGGCD